MLVLTRHVHQSIVIGQDVVVTVLEVRGDQVRLGITAPKDIQVHREEVFAALNAANRDNARPQPQLDLVEGHRVPDKAEGVDRAEIVEPAEGAPGGSIADRYRGAGRVGAGETARESAGRNVVARESVAKDGAARDVAGRASAAGNGAAGDGAGGIGPGAARAGGEAGSSVSASHSPTGHSPTGHSPTGHVLPGANSPGKNSPGSNLPGANSPGANSRSANSRSGSLAGGKDGRLATRTPDLGEESQPEPQMQPQQRRQPEHGSQPPGGRWQLEPSAGVLGRLEPQSAHYSALSVTVVSFATPGTLLRLFNALSAVPWLEPETSHTPQCKTKDYLRPPCR